MSECVFYAKGIVVREPKKSVFEADCDRGVETVKRLHKEFEVIDRAVHNSPPPMDDVGGLDPEDLDLYDPDRLEPKRNVAPSFQADCDAIHERYTRKPHPIDPLHGRGTPALLADRQTTHGDFRDNGHIMQGMKELARSGPSWKKLLPYQREGLEMILHKVGRIVCGDPNYADHWDDISGYAVRVSSYLFP